MLQAYTASLGIEMTIGTTISPTSSNDAAALWRCALHAVEGPGGLLWIVPWWLMGLLGPSLLLHGAWTMLGDRIWPLHLPLRSVLPNPLPAFCFPNLSLTFCALPLPTHNPSHLIGLLAVMLSTGCNCVPLLLPSL